MTREVSRMLEAERQTVVGAGSSAAATYLNLRRIGGAVYVSVRPAPGGQFGAIERYRGFGKRLQRIRERAWGRCL